MKTGDNVRLAIARIVKQRDFSLSSADALVTAILTDFPNDHRFEDILEVLAQYRPGGGEFLFDEKRLENECKNVLTFLCM